MAYPFAKRETKHAVIAPIMHRKKTFRLSDSLRSQLSGSKVHSNRSKEDDRLCNGISITVWVFES